MLLRLTKLTFLLLIFSLGFMQPYQYLYGMTIPFTDLIFLVTFGLWIISLFFKQTKFQWHNFFWLLGAYFLAILLSAIFSDNHQRSFIKVLGEIYLLSLPVLTFNLVQTNQFAKRVLQSWLSAASVVIIVGILTVILFYLDRENWLLKHTLFHFGTLPPGNYPRLQSTFVNANMLCNYFSVSLMITLIAEKNGWISKSVFYTIFGGILFCSIWTFSPGLGGIGLSVGIWYWLYLKQKKRLLALGSFAFGSFIALMFLIALVISPNLYPTAPFYVELPLIEKRIEPSVRFLTWTAAFQTFKNNPLVGVGIDQPVCEVHYLDLSGIEQNLDDAHNLYLNVAAQEGVFGLLSICAIIFYIGRKLFPLIANDDKRTIFRIGLALAFLSGVIYQGFGGSFEDTRHLWVLIGLCLTAKNIS